MKEKEKRLVILGEDYERVRIVNEVDEIIATITHDEIIVADGCKVVLKP